MPSRKSGGPGPDSACTIKTMHLSFGCPSFSIVAVGAQTTARIGSPTAASPPARSSPALLNRGLWLFWGPSRSLRGAVLLSADRVSSPYYPTA
ncbi:hypothetical protein TgHK011_001012 [Trichoderma gracile]|nr:hypothetical protein TgHK011_001012 [Trichoderma gracile]